MLQLGLGFVHPRRRMGFSFPVLLYRSKIRHDGGGRGAGCRMRWQLNSGQRRALPDR